MTFKKFLFPLSAALLFSCSQSPQKTSVEKNQNNNQEQNKQKFELSYSFLDLDKSPNGVAPIRSKKDISLILASYFDIEKESPAGTIVKGRINYRNNFKSEIPTSLTFKIEDPSKTLTVSKELDSYGRLFATLKTSKKLDSGINSIPFTIKLYDGDKLIEEKQASVQVLDQTVWSGYFDKTLHLINENTRLLGRYKISKNEAKKHLKDLAQNNARFPDLKFYELKTPEQRLKAFDRRAYSNLLIEAAERLAGLSLYNSNIKSPETKKSNARLIVKAIAEYSRAFPFDNFHTHYNIPHNDITHQWRYGDPLIGASIYALKEVLDDLRSDSELKKDFDAMNHFHLMTSMSLTEKYRDPKNLRYYLKQDKTLRLATGIWADANRHHRMRTWICQVALQMDYNQPLTYLPYWYFPYKEWGEQRTNILPEWEPSGALYDLKVWTDTNGRLTSLHQHSGLKPDGTISHHTGVRQDMAHSAYGFEWMSEGLYMPANMLKGTAFEADLAPFQSSIDFFLYAYPKMMYKGSMDYQTTGRSHYSNMMGKFAREVFTPGVNKVIKLEGETKSPNSLKLENYIVALEDDMETESGTTAFWVNDYLVHRRAGQSPYFMSVKLQSARSCGAEGFKGSGDYGFHNGSGIFQLKVDGREYDQARYAMDWHAMPGLTEELRDDRIPLSSEKKAYSTEDFCNALSDGQHGLASFQYSRTDPYSSASAFKSYFFQGKTALMLGNSIQRTKQGQGKPICTTIEQVEWDDTLTHNLSGELSSIAKGQDIEQKFKIKQASWLHHDGIGYFVFPKNEQAILLRTGEKVNRSDLKSKSTQELFQLSIDHGIKPESEQYFYIIIPHLELEQMDGKLAELKQIKILNTEKGQVIKSDSMIQAVFKKAATLEIDGLEITCDQPALLQLRKKQNQWIITAADPMHDPELKEINFTINQKFKAGEYKYATQGPEQKVLDCQKVIISTDDNKSKLKFYLPDSSDQEAYALRHELYAGMAASIILPEQ